jgi:hypothetical protein
MPLLQPPIGLGSQDDDIGLHSWADRGLRRENIKSPSGCGVLMAAASELQSGSVLLNRLTFPLPRAGSPHSQILAHSIIGNDNVAQHQGHG